MRIEEEVAQIELGEQLVDAFDESALGQPDTAREAAETVAVVAHRHKRLGALSGRLVQDQQVGVGGTACQDVEDAGVLQSGIGGDQIPTTHRKKSEAAQ